MEQKLAQPNLGMAVVLALMVVGIQIVLAVPLGIIDVVVELGMHLPSPQLERQPLIIGCINLLAFGGAIALGLYLNRLPFRRAFPMRRVAVMQLTGVAILLLGGAVLLSEADNAFRWLAPPPRWLADMIRDLFAAEDKLLSRVFLLVLVAPVTEELLFRGIILRGLLSRHRPAVAVALSAALFTAVHLNPWQFCSAFALGILLGWLYLRTASLTLCVFTHAFFNGLSILFSVLPLEIPGMTGTPDFRNVMFQPWWLDIIGLSLVLVGLWIVRRATPPPKIEKPPIPPIIPDIARVSAHPLQTDQQARVFPAKP
jgi:membrane protease YdiL (CAAX protease family)